MRFPLYLSEVGNRMTSLYLLLSIFKGQILLINIRHSIDYQYA